MKYKNVTIHRILKKEKKKERRDRRDETRDIDEYRQRGRKII